MSGPITRVIRSCDTWSLKESTRAGFSLHILRSVDDVLKIIGTVLPKPTFRLSMQLISLDVNFVGEQSAKFY